MFFCACDFSLERKKSKNRKICQMKEFCVPRQTRLKRKKVKKKTNFCQKILRNIKHFRNIFVSKNIIGTLQAHFKLQYFFLFFGAHLLFLLLKERVFVAKTFTTTHLKKFRLLLNNTTVYCPKLLKIT